ncbi:MAG: hypothetical protein HZC37_17410 [Burkholderiales bacterium]|nr:hypothetical protein [Burkholderiales bacterium]
MTVAPALLLALKLGLVLVAVLAASLVSRRFGHAAGGLLAGMPMIAGPITGLLLIDLPNEAVRAVCLATLACQPAMIAYLVALAHLARWWRWPACLAVALALHFGCGVLLLMAPLPEWGRVALAIAAPALGLRAMPSAARRGGLGGPVELPRIELACRIAVALVVAAGVLWGAQHLSTGLAGLLLAAPVAGMVLPAFTLPRHGSVATAALLAGFVRGQIGFVSFFVVMLLALPRLPGALCWGVAMLASAVLPWAWASRHAAASRAAGPRDLV